MSLLTKEELKMLIDANDGLCVSIFMPTHRAGPETRQDPIRLKNLVTAAEEKLIAEGMRSPEARTLLQPAAALIEDYDFWQQQNEGLAIFVSADLFRLYRLPLELEELLIIADRFHLKPLIPVLSDDRQFYILALSQNEVRLFRGEQYNIYEMGLEDVPTSLAEALQYDDPEKQQQFHTATPAPGGGERAAMFHGHGVGSDDEDKNLRRFCQLVERGLQPYLRQENAPLVLACVDHLYPIYKEANTYAHLVEDHVSGNPDEWTPKTLHERAWPIVEPIFQQTRLEAAKQYKNLTDSEQASKDIRTIVPAAHYGRVDTLFVALGEQQWGAFDPQTNRIDLQAAPDPQNEDLLDAATVQTILNGGTVYAVEPENVPDQVPLAAIFRY